MTVFVKCSSCAALVARYELSAYYHHGKGFESWLRSFAGAAESGRALTGKFEAVKRDALQQFDEVLAILKALGKDV